MKLLGIINLLRGLSLVISLVAFVCHISQCYLLNSYQIKTGIPDWLVAGHWQYLVWYIFLSLSLVGGLVSCLNAVYFRRFSVDKYVALLSFLLVIISILAIMTSDSMEPWTNGKTEGGHFLASCGTLFDASKDELNSILYNRCLLNNSTCVSAIFLCIVWVSLTGLSIFASRRHSDKNPKLAKNVIHPAVKEPIWGRYIPDPPSSIYSATIVDNRSGLLTPSSALTRDKHTEFYSNCSSIYKEKTRSLSSSTSDYFSKGDYYSKPSSVYYYGETIKMDREDSDESKTRDQPLLRVSTTFHSSISPSVASDIESATTMTGTPLYEKFSKSTTTFDHDSPSSRYYNSRW